MHKRTSHLRGVAVGTLALVALLGGRAIAGTPNTIAYHFSSHPMIAGTVVTVNDHQMVVDTDQGEQVTLELGSGTMAPRDLEPGMVMRAEFLALEDCRFYAERILPVRGGVSINRQQAYANSRDSREVIERNATAGGSYNRGYSREVYASEPNADTRESRLQSIGPHSRGSVVIATPNSADYLSSTRPMVSGRVVSVNDHSLVIDSEQGQRVGLIMDSRTMVPREVTPGSYVRAQFEPMKDGRYLANRIRTVEGSVANREQAYAYTRDSDLALAKNTTDCGCMNTVTHYTTTAAVAQPAPERVVYRDVVLPQTASNQPLILLLGFLALGCAGAVMAVRSRRTA